MFSVTSIYIFFKIKMSSIFGDQEEDDMDIEELVIAFMENIKKNDKNNLYILVNTDTGHVEVYNDTPKPNFEYFIEASFNIVPDPLKEFDIPQQNVDYKKMRQVFDIASNRLRQEGINLRHDFFTTEEISSLFKKEDIYES